MLTLPSGPTAKAVVQNGGKSWYFVSADYSFGQATYEDAAAAIKQAGGTVLGNTRHPLGASDFSSYLLTAQASKADVVAFANASDDLTNSVRQAYEFGSEKHQKMVGFFLYFNVINSLGLKRSKGLISATPTYWDLNAGTREWTARFLKTEKIPPTATHTLTYSAVLHYLKAIKTANSDDAEKVAAAMRRTDVNDVFVKSARIRDDGRVMIDLLLTRVKQPEDSKYPFDYLDVISTIPAAEAYRPEDWSACKYTKRS